MLVSLRHLGTEAARRADTYPVADPQRIKEKRRCHVVESLMRVRQVPQLKSCGGDDFAPRLRG
jgi:hypothetical protein